MNFILTSMALLIFFGPVAVGQTLPHASDCLNSKYSRRKVSCLCGSVEICAGDICGSPSIYELDDDITVELRSKSGSTLDTQKVVLERISEQGTKQSGTATTYQKKERRFSFKDKQDGDYLLAFVLHKNGVSQPAVIFPTNYSQKRQWLGEYVYMVQQACPSVL